MGIMDFGFDLRTDLVKQHDFMNMFILPLIGLMSVFSTLTGNPTSCLVVIRTLITYMACDAIYIALRPGSVPSAKLVLFHHFVSVCGLSHGLRFAPAIREVAAYGLIEIHTSFMTYRRLTGLRSPSFEAVFHIVTVLVRLVFIPGLALVSIRNLYGLGVLFKPSGMPGLSAVLGLSIFNIQFLLKRKAMFNYSGKKQQ
ncbi:hypothetical protein HOP50_03g23450 [Chloropicon primus]|nr:hypothetical protein HOP50_03g23450 [Chloropicon primus]